MKTLVKKAKPEFKIARASRLKLKRERTVDGVTGRQLERVESMVTFVEEKRDAGVDASVFPPNCGRTGWHLDGKARVLFLKKVDKMGMVSERVRATRADKRQHTPKGEKITKSVRYFRIAALDKRSANKAAARIRKDQIDDSDDEGGKYGEESESECESESENDSDSNSSSGSSSSSKKKKTPSSSSSSKSKAKSKAKPETDDDETDDDDSTSKSKSQSKGKGKGKSESKTRSKDRKSGSISSTSSSGSSSSSSKAKTAKDDEEEEDDDDDDDDDDFEKRGKKAKKDAPNEEGEEEDDEQQDEDEDEGEEEEEEEEEEVGQGEEDEEEEDNESGEDDQPAETNMQCVANAIESNLQNGQGATFTLNPKSKYQLTSTEQPALAAQFKDSNNVYVRFLPASPEECISAGNPLTIDQYWVIVARSQDAVTAAVERITNPPAAPTVSKKRPAAVDLTGDSDSDDENENNGISSKSSKKGKK